MSLQDILKKIIDDSQMVIEQIEAETESSKKEVRSRYEKQKERALVELAEKTDKAVNSVDDKIRLMARRENAKLLSEAKQEVIKKALKMLLERLETADEALYKKILKQLFVKITEKEGSVLTAFDRVEVTKSCLPDGLKAEVVGDNNIRGGFVFKGKQSEIDNTFHELVFSEFHSELTTYFAEQLRLI